MNIQCKVHFKLSDGNRDVNTTLNRVIQYKEEVKSIELEDNVDIKWDNGVKLELDAGGDNFQILKSLINEYGEPNMIINQKNKLYK